MVFFIKGHQAYPKKGWVVLTKPSDKTLDGLEKFCFTCDQIVNKVGSPPRTCTQWSAKMYAARRAVADIPRKNKAPRIGGSGYIVLWG